MSNLISFVSMLSLAAVVVLFLAGTIPPPHTTLRGRIRIHRYPKYIWPMAVGPVPYNSSSWFPADINAAGSYVASESDKKTVVGRRRYYQFPNNRVIQEVVESLWEPNRIAYRIDKCTLRGLPSSFSMRLELYPESTGAEAEWTIDWYTGNPFKRFWQTGMRSEMREMMEKSLRHLKVSAEHSVKQLSIPTEKPVMVHDEEPLVVAP